MRRRAHRFTHHHGPLPTLDRRDANDPDEYAADRETLQSKPSKSSANGSATPTSPSIRASLHVDDAGNDEGPGH